MRVLTTIACATLVCSTADALTFAQYKAAKDHPQSGTWQAVQAYLDGVYEGFNLANSELKDRNQPGIYCAPLDLNVQNLEDLVEKSIEHTKGNPRITDDNSSVSTGMFFELKYTFPCKAK